MDETNQLVEDLDADAFDIPAELDRSATKPAGQGREDDVKAEVAKDEEEN